MLMAGTTGFIGSTMMLSASWSIWVYLIENRLGQTTPFGPISLAQLVSAAVAWHIGVAVTLFAAQNVIVIRNVLASRPR